MTPSPPDPSERLEAGRAARKRVPRSSLGEWDPPADRPDSVGILTAQEPDRLAELVPLRHGRMAVSPWTYLRGAAAVMAADLATAPSTGLEVQLCGDAHIVNFGLWATPERHLSFDLRDFDETLPGPFEWDVKRLATSIVVLARNDHRSGEDAAEAVRAAVREYTSAMARYATLGSLDVWYDRIDADQLLARVHPRDRQQLTDRLERTAAKRTSRGAFAKLTTVIDGQRRITEDPPRRVRYRSTDTPEAREVIDGVYDRYLESLPDDRRHFMEQYSYIDAVRQVVGVGSVGMRVGLLLLEGRGGDADPLFLQVKQATASVYEPHLGQSRYDNHGARVVNGQRLIQSASDMLLGWTSFGDVDFYVRQFRDMKVIPDANRVGGQLRQFAALCGATLAKAHARSGDPLVISAYLGSGKRFADAMVGFAEAYADQTERDHARLVAAIADGEVAAAPG